MDRGIIYCSTSSSQHPFKASNVFDVQSLGWISEKSTNYFLIIDLIKKRFILQTVYIVINNHIASQPWFISGSRDAKNWVELFSCYETRQMKTGHQNLVFDAQESDSYSVFKIGSKQSDSLQYSQFGFNFIEFFGILIQ
jgi:hypothetical protein